LEKVKLAAPGDSTILIQGESGTGKEIFADAIRKLSSRRDGPYIRVNCSALNESLFESEMFGHEKGAFTGAHHQHVGRFERADGGTIFLDDIDDLSPAMQKKLLRVFQEREFERVGGKKVIPIDVRIISATKTDLNEKVRSDEFRQDFFYRLSVVSIQIPPLRSRRSDIPLLVQYFLQKSTPGKTTAKETMDILAEHDWPGNVRELQNAVEQMCIFSTGDKILPDSLPKNMEKTGIWDDVTYMQNPGTGDSLDEIIRKTELKILTDTLSRFDNNQQKVAEYLRIPRTTLRSKLQKHRLI